MEFIPCTQERDIGDGVVFRQIKSWHSGTYAGEGLFAIPGTKDGSGCLRREKVGGLPVCSPPYTVAHRLYWKKGCPKRKISAFLSYPDGMGASDGEYFWEANGTAKNDIERFFGPRAEAKMEAKIRKVLSRR